MNPKFFPIYNLFLEAAISGVEHTLSDATLTLARRYGMSPEAAQALLLESGQTRWFRFLISGNTMHWRSAGARARVDIHGFRDCWDLMQDGVWRSPDTIIVQTSMRISQARDICDALEALGLLDSKVIFPKETVYAKIHGAIPAFYSPNFNIL